MSPNHRHREAPSKPLSLLLPLSCLALVGCSDPWEGSPADETSTPSAPTTQGTPTPVTPTPTVQMQVHIPAAEQRPGDPDAGWEFMVYGGYAGSGMEYDMFLESYGVDEENRLGREGDNAVLPPDWNAFDAPNGVRVVGNNCFACHAGYVDGQYVPGLGDSRAVFTFDLGPAVVASGAVVKATYGPNSPEWQAYEPTVLGFSYAGPYMLAPFQGVSPAFMIEEAVVAWRDPSTLYWLASPLFEVPEETLCSDTPPLWHVKKKNALYYNGMGRGDHARMLQQIGVVGLFDVDQAEEHDPHVPDMLAWMASIEPPAYPEAIDEALAAEGEGVFLGACASCHGTYGEVESYPNLLIHYDEVGTDRAYADYFLENTGLPDWVAAGWFGERAELIPSPGYMAPPLDGVWATAPYLHNGSIPTLRALLDSSQRPTIWRRDFNDLESWDYQDVGWPFTEVEAVNEEGNEDYDTRLHGYSNVGHPYGDDLSGAERDALIEYLKTL